MEHIYQASDLASKRRELMDAARAGLAQIRDTDGTGLVMVPQGRFELLRALREQFSRYIALEAIFEREGRSVVYVAGHRPRPREVVLGPSSADFVVIEKGLSRGERVLLRDPEAALPEFSGAPGS